MAIGEAEKVRESDPETLRETQVGMRGNRDTERDRHRTIERQKLG